MIGYALLLILGAQAAAPTRPAPSSPPVRVAPAGERRPVAYTTVNGLAVFRARVAGRLVWALLDNRAERSFVDLGFARQAGLRIDPRRSVRIDAGAGLSGQQVARVPIAVEGQFSTTLPTMIGTDLSAVSRSFGRTITLVVGADFYRRFAVATLPDAGTLQFLPSGSVRVPQPPVALLDTRPRVAIVLGGERFVVTVDSGFSGALLLTQAASARLGLASARCEPRSFRTGDGSARTGRSCAGPAGRMGPITFPATQVFVSEVAAANGDGLVGMELLGRGGGGLVVDVSARKLWLLPVGQRVGTAPAARAR